MKKLITFSIPVLLIPVLVGCGSPQNYSDDYDGDYRNNQTSTFPATPRPSYRSSSSSYNQRKIKSDSSFFKRSSKSSSRSKRR